MASLPPLDGGGKMQGAPSRPQPLGFGPHLHRHNQRPPLEPKSPNFPRQGRGNLATPVLWLRSMDYVPRIFTRKKGPLLPHFRGYFEPARRLIHKHHIYRLQRALSLSLSLSPSLPPSFFLCCCVGANWEEEFLLFSNDDPKNEPLTE